MKITNEMTVAQAYAALGVTDKSYIEQRRALSDAIGGDQAFEDWLVNGDVSDDDTIAQIWTDWNDDA